MKNVAELKVKIFADGADLNSIRAFRANPLVKGFTTNPTLMRAAGVTDYAGFARQVLAITGSLPVSFEVFADELDEMELQALEIATWGEAVFVKIPVTTTSGQSCAPLIKRLSAQGIKVNVTALLTLAQVEVVADALATKTPAFISVFAGRIADTGVDPIPVMQAAVGAAIKRPLTEIIWASPRELLNVFHAEHAGVQVITVTPELLKKLDLVGKDLVTYSLETVKMFRRDAVAAGYSIALPAAATQDRHG